MNQMPAPQQVLCHNQRLAKLTGGEIWKHIARVPIKWSEIRSVCGIIVVERKITAKLAVISACRKSPAKAGLFRQAEASPEYPARLDWYLWLDHNSGCRVRQRLSAPGDRKACNAIIKESTSGTRVIVLCSH